jgi:hypothetical protein
MVEGLALRGWPQLGPVFDKPSVGLGPRTAPSSDQRAPLTIVLNGEEITGASGLASPGGDRTFAAKPLAELLLSV